MSVVPMECGHWTRPSACTGTIYDFCGRCDKYQRILPADSSLRGCSGSSPEGLYCTFDRPHAGRCVFPRSALVVENREAPDA
jgi:hypothetical protein